MRSALVEMLHPAAELAPVEWRVAANPVPYEEAVAAMQDELLANDLIDE